jgi:uncharacterized protein (TIGR00369 family)
MEAMPELAVIDEGCAERVAAMFACQPFMISIGARILRLGAGVAVIELPHRSDLTQQHGYFHGGVTSAIADNAGGCAAYTLFPPQSDILTVEFKINLLAPAAGDKLVALGTVIKSGRTLTVCELKVHGLFGDRETLCAIGQQTLIRLDASAARSSAQRGGHR